MCAALQELERLSSCRSAAADRAQAVLYMQRMSCVLRGWDCQKPSARQGKNILVMALRPVKALVNPALKAILVGMQSSCDVTQV